jgi:chemotaxis protein CheD
MLPCSQGRSERPGKFADTAVDILYRELQSLGVKSGSVIAKLAGGACMFKTFNGNLGIGERNIEAVRDQVRKRGIKIRGEDVGGTSGRSLVYFPSDKGQILVRKADGSITEL